MLCSIFASLQTLLISQICFAFLARRKRTTTDGGDEKDTAIKYSLDKVFEKEEKTKFELLVKQIKANFTTNFQKMDLVKSYPNLFELLW